MGDTLLENAKVTLSESVHVLYTSDQNLAAHRQGYRVTSLHTGNGWVTL